MFQVTLYEIRQCAIESPMDHVKNILFPNLQYGPMIILLPQIYGKGPCLIVSGSNARHGQPLKKSWYSQSSLLRKHAGDKMLTAQAQTRKGQVKAQFPEIPKPDKTCWIIQNF